MPTDLLDHELDTAAADVPLGQDRVDAATASARPALPQRAVPGRAADRRRRNEARCWRLVGAARALRVDDLDWDAVADTAVDDDVIEALVYMRDVEGFTDRELVGLAGHVT